jgi:hypothetical protein
MAAKPKLPPAPPVVRMPAPDDANAAAAKKRAQNSLMASRGRDSTDLTGADAVMDGTSSLGR